MVPVRAKDRQTTSVRTYRALGYKKVILPLWVEAYKFTNAIMRLLVSSSETTENQTVYCVIHASLKAVAAAAATSRHTCLRHQGRVAHALNFTVHRLQNCKLRIAIRSVLLL